MWQPVDNLVFKPIVIDAPPARIMVRPARILLSRAIAYTNSQDSIEDGSSFFEDLLGRSG